jgi:hypothetical protein
LRVEL